MKAMGCSSSVSVNQALHDFVDRISDEEAEDLLEWLAEKFGTSLRVIPLSEAERDAIRRGLADLKAGRTVAYEEIEREFGSVG